MKAAVLFVALALAACTSTSGEKPDEERDTMNVSTDPVALEGHWKGTLVAGAQKIPLVFNVERKADGSYGATLDSPEENLFGLPVESVVVREGEVTFSLPVTQAEYVATISPDGETLTGVWKQRGARLDLVFTKADSAAELPSRPQEPFPPYPYRSIEVTFPNPTAGITLAGTVTIPEGNGPFPGVVLITGSGPQDRNESIFGHKPFLVLADSLTRAGVAVLRFDDRGVGESGGEGGFDAADSADLATDAAAAHLFLRSYPAVDSSKVGLLGHSEGGAIAPLVASDDATVAFVVLLAGPGVKGIDLLVMQSEAIMKASGMADAMVSVLSGYNRRTYQAILDHPDDPSAKAEVTKIMKELGMTQEQIDAQVPTLLSKWYRYFLAYDPAPVLRSLRVPVLALNGTLDTQVPAAANLAAIEDALAESPTSGHRVEALEGLNHLFQHATTGLVDEYGKIEETFAPEALEIITTWIIEVTR